MRSLTFCLIGVSLFVGISSTYIYQHHSHPVFYYARSYVAERPVSEKGADIWSHKPDLEWFGSIKKWHIPLWSRFYQVRTATEVLEKSAEEIKLDPNANSCLVFETPNKVSGFGKDNVFDIQATETSFDFKSPYSKAKQAKFTFTLTDNKSFMLGVTDWEDGERGWAVLSKNQGIDGITASRILKHITSLGFNPELAKWESFIGCP